MKHDKFCPVGNADSAINLYAARSSVQVICICSALQYARADEREQAAQRVNDHIGRYGIPQPDWTEVDAVAWYEAHIAAARGEDTN